MLSCNPFIAEAASHRFITLIIWNYIKVAEHSFQVLMPNSPLLLNNLCFDASFLQESWLTTEVFILAFWLGRVLLSWQWS